MKVTSRLQAPETSITVTFFPFSPWKEDRSMSGSTGFPRTEQSVSPVVEEGARTVTLKPAVAVLLAATGTPPDTRSSAVWGPCTFNHA